MEYVEEAYGSDIEAFEDLDIQQVIIDAITSSAGADKTLDERRLQDIALLEDTYTDVMLVFDYDPQDDRFDAGRLGDFMTVFCDSTDRGALYLNYPFVESFCDFSGPRDLSYLTKLVSVSKLDVYKAGLGGRTYRDVSHITGPAASIIAINASKIQHLVDDVPAEKTISGSSSRNLAETVIELSLVDFLDLENQLLTQEGSVYVCNTCLFFICQWPRAVNGAWRKALRLE